MLVLCQLLAVMLSLMYVIYIRVISKQNMTTVATYLHVRTIALAATDNAVKLALSLCVQVDFGSSPGCTEQ